MVTRQEAMDAAIKNGGFSKWMSFMQKVTENFMLDNENISVRELHCYLYDDFANN